MKPKKLRFEDKLRDAVKNDRKREDAKLKLQAEESMQEYLDRIYPDIDWRGKE